MTERQAGITALVTAYARVYHAEHDSPKIFDDFLAGQLFTPEEHASYDQNLANLLPLVDPELAATHPDPATALARVIQLHNGPVTLSRSRYTEECLAEGVIHQGVEQYVILGAGMDTFAFRSPGSRLQVFEVDHPVTQEMKRQRIAAAGWRMTDNLHFVPIDFTRSSIAAELRRSSYDPRKLSLFSWLGVSFYLPLDVVSATLRDLAGLALPGSTIIFDYLDADAFLPEKAGKRIQLMQWIAGQVGEPMKTGFDPAALAGYLDGLGFTLQDNLSPAAIEARYFQHRQDHYHAFEHFHFAKATVK